MKTVTVALRDEVAQLLEARSLSLGLTLEQLLARGVEEHLAKLATLPSRSWVSRERWEALVRGDGCPICAELSAEGEVWEDGFLAVELPGSRLKLMRNQYLPGYCVLYCRRHVREPHELREREGIRFFDELTRAAAVIERIFSPTKLNLEIQGNGIPHLHAHIKPRYIGDDAPGIPIDQNARTVVLEPDEYRRLVTRLREGLG